MWNISHVAIRGPRFGPHSRHASTGWGYSSESVSKQVNWCPQGLNPYCRPQKNLASSHSRSLNHQDTKWASESKGHGENILPLLPSKPILWKGNASSRGSCSIEQSTRLSATYKPGPLHTASNQRSLTLSVICASISWPVGITVSIFWPCLWIPTKALQIR